MLRGLNRGILAGAVSMVPLGFAAWAGAAAPPRTPAKVLYNRDVRPILAENCFACHGPDSAARKADLRLDTFAEATAPRNGRPAVVKGKPEASELIKRVTGHGAPMPPRSTNKKLTPQQVATLRQWVAQGAEYEQHWAYLAPRRPVVPAVKDKTWPRTTIDRFILARLEAAGLRPAPEADRRTLARRLSLDLTGLPPDPADVEAFVNDKSPDAYEKLVDRYLASPAWGEHRGRYWLDAARYADTHGIHFDNYREIWAYRDWVIRALNQNMPFDQFTIEQLAGDLLPNPTLDQQIATGFHRCNITTNEGGVIPEEYVVLYARDRTETTAQVWLATTAGCAVCHNHKFDPVTTLDFYSLSAFFNNTTQNVMDGNIKDTPPTIPVAAMEDRDRLVALQSEMSDARKQVADRRAASRADFDRWLAGGNTGSVAASMPGEGLLLHLPLAEGSGNDVAGALNGQPIRVTASGPITWTPGHVGANAYLRQAASALEIAGAGDFEKEQSFTVSTWVRLSRNDQGGAIVARMDDGSDYRGWDLWVENGRVGTHIISKWPENALKVVARDRLQANKWHHVAMVYSGGANPAAVRIYIDGTPREADVQANSLSATIRTTVPFKIGQRHTSSPVDGAGVQDVRLYGRALSALEVDNIARGSRAAYLVSRGTAGLSAAEKDELFAWWLPGMDADFRTLSTRLAALEAEDRTIRQRGTLAYVMKERDTEAMAYILFRGEYDKRRDAVKPATPAFLPPLPKGAPLNRLSLAKWLVAPENPLTARVTVNRFWQEIFGNGIVRSSGDFGMMGELPSHPELLDWMALEFRDRGWDMKQFFKMLVTSATYRQSAAITPEKHRKDPQNRLLSRSPRFRMDAEMLRDYALAASGLLSRKIGGPSVKPYQPDGVWEAVAMIGSNTRDYRRDTGEAIYRRSMYTLWKRAAPPASMEIFNAPNRETCVVKRERTNTPLQALVTLNDVQFVEAARVLAQHALRAAPSATGRMDFIARRLLARPLRPEEAKVVARSAAELEAYYKSHPEDAKALVAVGEAKAEPGLAPEPLAAWTMVVNQLMNLDEVLNK